MTFSGREALVLNHIQHGIPMVRRPFAGIGKNIGIPESEVIQIISELKKCRVIRNMAAIFNPQSLGYILGLVGMKVPESRIDQASLSINSHPGVSHNYLRNHPYNIWFTLAEENEGKFNRSVDFLTRTTGASDTLVLKTTKVYKIGVKLPVGNRHRIRGTESEDVSYRSPKAGGLTWEERNAISILQKDLPIVERPFSNLVSESNPSIGEDRLLELGKSFKDRHIMRRYAAVLKHRNAGFTHNAMTVWKLPDGKASIAGIDAFIREPAVSHLYTRKIHPGKWEYPLFAMIHLQSEPALIEVVERLSRESGITDYQVLRSLREFKKKRVDYFSPNFEKWHDQTMSHCPC